MSSVTLPIDRAVTSALVKPMVMLLFASTRDHAILIPVGNEVLGLTITVALGVAPVTVTFIWRVAV